MSLRGFLRPIFFGFLLFFLRFFSRRKFPWILTTFVANFIESLSNSVKFRSIFESNTEKYYKNICVCVYKMMINGENSRWIVQEEHRPILEPNGQSFYRINGINMRTFYTGPVNHRLKMQAYLLSDTWDYARPVLHRLQRRSWIFK